VLDVASVRMDPRTETVPAIARESVSPCRRFDAGEEAQRGVVATEVVERLRSVDLGNGVLDRVAQSCCAARPR
jgi:hypothetical protein